MNILYVTSVWSGIKYPNMHVDFINEAYEQGNMVTVLALSEKRNQEKTNYKNINGIDILTVQCGNIQKTNKYKKVISSLGANDRIVRATNRYLKNKKIDIVIWSVSTTLIYFGVKKITKKLKAPQYLLLKEYWPQDPVDLGAMKKGGLIYRFFKFVEKNMFLFADRIGTSSPAGVDYVLTRYPENNGKVEVCPHCEKNRTSAVNKEAILQKYGLDNQKFNFIYGGNLGLSQGPKDVVANIKSVSDVDSARFIFLGSGTEFDKVKESLKGQNNVIFKNPLPYNEFFELGASCDCGMIFLFKNYNVPNIPGKFNTYLNCELPVLSCVDKTTDLGSIINENNVGISVSSGDTKKFAEAVSLMILNANIFKSNCKKLLLSSYTPNYVLDKITKFYEERQK